MLTYALTYATRAIAALTAVTAGADGSTILDSRFLGPHVPLLVQVFWSMLTYADVCLRMLT